MRVALLLLFFIAAAGAVQPPVVGAIGMTVSDMERSVAFYTKVLTFRKTADREFHDPAVDRLLGVFGARIRVVDLCLGRETLQLLEFRNVSGRPIPLDSRSNDAWFQHVAIVVRDMDAAVKRLDKFRVKPTSPEPQRLPDWNRKAAGIRAFYFRDPDNHNLEIIQFPPGKGDPRWQKKGGSLFRGVDHTAIVVKDTERSLRLYCGRLGLHVVGESRNSGIEQEYLNHVKGARVRITSLRGASGPGVEFLEYLSPGAGRSFPVDAGPSDILHWQTLLEYRTLPSSGGMRRISPEAITLPTSSPWRGEGLLVRDPDGHALLLDQP
jgi:catechol 2,3-dioxygenase-like lactoylglutathione lyase family enzyme